MFSSLESAKFQPTDLSAFLSTFTYNAQGQTKIADIPDQVYSESDFKFFTRTAYPTHGPLPQVHIILFFNKKYNLYKILNNKACR